MKPPYARFARCPPKGKVSPLGRPGGTDMRAPLTPALSPLRGERERFGDDRRARAMGTSLSPERGEGRGEGPLARHAEPATNAALPAAR